VYVALIWSLFYFIFSPPHCFIDYFTSPISKMSCNFIFLQHLRQKGLVCKESVAMVQGRVEFHDIVIVGYLVYPCFFFCFGSSLYLLYDDVMYVMI